VVTRGRFVSVKTVRDRRRWNEEWRAVGGGKGVLDIKEAEE
jgi:hypothetical protein